MQQTITANQAPISPVIERGAFSIQASPTMEDLGERFIKYAGVAPTSVKTYSKALKVFFDWMQAHAIEQPTRDDLTEYRQELLATRKPTTTASYINAVKQFFKWLSYEGFSIVNLAEHLKGAKLPKGFRKDALTQSQAKELLESIDTTSLEGLRDEAMIALATTCALRTIELERANIEDIRPHGGFIALFVQGKGRTDKDELVKMPDEVEKLIRVYLKARGETNEQAPLFASHSDRNNGERLTTNSISRIIKTHLRECGMDSPRLTAHSLRHTGITLALLNGSTLEEAQQMARHSSINTTMIYNHAIERAKNDSENRVASAIL